MGVGQYKRDFRCRPCQSRQCGAPRPAEVPIDAIVEPHRGQLFTRPAVQSTWLVARVLYDGPHRLETRSEEHTSELQSLMRISYAVFCLIKKQLINIRHNIT